MALARAQWDAEIQGKSAAEQSAWTADDYTEFNSDFPVRIDGKALNDRLYEAQMRGGGKTSPSLAKSTRVYAKPGGQWKLVHANFAPVTSPQDCPHRRRAMAPPSRGPCRAFAACCQEPAVAPVRACCSRRRQVGRPDASGTPMLWAPPDTCCAGLDRMRSCGSL